jgi:DNA polymerase (family 10)
MTNREIAVVFDQVADLLEFQAANPFRVRAYRNGAHRIRDLAEPLSAIAADANRSLTDIQGIGKDLAEKIRTLLDTGSLPMLAELQQDVPAGVVLISRVPGVGPKKAVTLCRELGIESLAELRKACDEQRVRGLKGFGAKTEATILKGLAVAEEAGVRMRWADAQVIVDALLEHMRTAPGVAQLETAGSFRRGRETVGDLDLLVDASDAGAVMDHFGQFLRVAEIVARGDTKMTVRLDNGLQVDLRVVPAESFGAALQYFTGSKEHNVAVRGRAKQRGLRVNEWGVFRLAAGAADEADDAAAAH